MNNSPLLTILLLLVGMSLSAFFSGCETGFYRATRIRFVLDALAGNLVARGLHWLSNNPAMFVATTLVGNNLANYVTSAAIVILTRQVAGDHHFTELLVTVAMSPVVFVYGELLPKSLFYYAPNTLLRRAGGLFLLCTLLFLPIAGILWALGRVLQGMLGQTPLKLQLALARQELQEAMQEGHEAGVLQPVQYGWALNLFAEASKDVSQFCSPLPREAVLVQGTDRQSALRIAKRLNASVLPVVAHKNGPLVGYVHAVDLYLQQEEQVEPSGPLLTVRAKDSHVAALIHMRSEAAPLAAVLDERGEMVGLLFVDQLTRPVVQGP